MDMICYGYYDYCPPCMCSCCQPTYQPVRRLERLTKRLSFPKLEPLHVKPRKVLHKKAINNENNANKINIITEAAQSSGRNQKLTKHENHIPSVPRNSAALSMKAYEKKYEKLYSSLKQPTNSKRYTTKERHQRHAAQESSSTSLIGTNSEKYLLEMRDNYRKRSQIPIPKHLSTIKSTPMTESNRNSKLLSENSLKIFQVEEPITGYRKDQLENLSKHSAEVEHLESSANKKLETEVYETLKDFSKTSQFDIFKNDPETKTPPTIASKPQENQEPTDCMTDCSSILMICVNEIEENNTEIEKSKGSRTSKQNGKLKQVKESLSKELKCTESHNKLYDPTIEKNATEINKSYTIIRLGSYSPQNSTNFRQGTPEASYDEYEQDVEDASTTAPSAEEIVIGHKILLTERNGESAKRGSREHISKQRFLQSSYSLALDHELTPLTASSSDSSVLSAETSLSNERVIHTNYSHLHDSVSVIHTHMKRDTISKAVNQKTTPQSSNSDTSVKESVLLGVGREKVAEQENQMADGEIDSPKIFDSSNSRKSTKEANAIQATPCCSCRPRSLKIAIEIQENQLNLRCNKNCAFNVISKQFRYPTSICESTTIPKTTQKLWAQGEYSRSTPQPIDKTFNYTADGSSGVPKRTKALRRQHEVSAAEQEVIEEESLDRRNTEKNLSHSNDWILVEADQQYEHAGSKETIITLDIVSLKPQESELEIETPSLENINPEDLLTQQVWEQFSDRSSERHFDEQNENAEEIVELAHESSHSLEKEQAKIATSQSTEDFEQMYSEQPLKSTLAERMSSCEKRKSPNGSTRSLLPLKRISTHNLRQRLTTLQEEIDALGAQRSSENETSTQKTAEEESARI